MADYRFYFLNVENKIVGVHETRDCTDDAHATEMAAELLAEKEKHPCVEIWDGPRKIGKHCR
jgi:hypothetical protein